MNPALVTSSTFLFGFISGFIVRKYWFLIRALLGLKRTRQPLKENAKTSEISTKNELENFETETSDSPKIVSKTMPKFVSHNKLIY